MESFLEESKYSIQTWFLVNRKKLPQELERTRIAKLAILRIQALEKRFLLTYGSTDHKRNADLTKRQDQEDFKLHHYQSGSLLVIGPFFW